jgi:hypothetical protein
MTKWLVRGASFSLAVGYCLNCLAPVAYALQSTNYRFDESTVGAGGLVQSNSANYQASSSIGDLGIGDAASANFQIEAGSQTTPDPTLSFSMNNSNANFGNFTPTSAAVSTASFSVSNYTSYGYVVQIAGTPPTNGSHALPALTTTSSSQTGVEQFGVNLVANTSPVSVGANPVHGYFAFGDATANYGVSNKYRYVSGEPIASAPKSSGVTTYTLTYLVNVGSLTPGGIYTSHQTLIVIGTY